MSETAAIDATTALDLQHVTKRFGRSAVALDDVSLSVPPGSFTVILGAAGAGKTTTLRTIAGLESPEEGRVILAGHDVGSWEPKDRNVSMIFDNLALYPNKTGFQNIASPLRIRGESPDVIKERVEKLAATLQVAHVLGRLPKTMSGGERQRIALGRALIRTPIIFLLDEPLSSLDAKLRIELRAELRRLQRDLGYTFLMATPDYNEALAIADSVVLLRKGRVVQVAPPQELYDLPVDREAASFVGAPQINLMPASAMAEGSSSLLAAAGARLPLPAHFLRLLGNAPYEFELGIRPENLALAPVDKAGITGAVIDFEPLGLKSVLTVRNDAAELRMLVDSAAAQSVSMGQEVGVEPLNPHLMLAFDKETGLRIGADDLVN
ncbi:ABC transporter ATP-binding protein [Oceanidesulfovibrio marinus]|uniref:ABC transporter ATP-binding protein n=1 Tax=Oceanidesulfovibrio marinus TaxID=370038 RepID=A0A6P1ZFF0_9BACT|nr:ABC transporter ATP-binding protein [Oceanidesulfovibrio marinus]TVM33414.1 ABC transporter ATP-binding protein [Oceanidesulfovibrio marinus]